MTKAICIPFHRYQPHNSQRYKVYFNYLKRALKIWGDEFDTLYLIDSDHGFVKSDIDPIDNKVVILPKSNNGSHWDNLRLAAKEIEEDQVLFLDMDVLIWQKGIVEKWFKWGEEYDVVTAFDGSGELHEQIWNRYNYLYELKASRMGTYYFVLNRKALALMSQTNLAPIRFQANTHIKELNYDVTRNDVDWLDSFGYFTLRLLYHNFTMCDINDERASFYLTKKGHVEHPEEGPQELGYYHIRNAALIVRLLDQNNEEFQDQFEELLEHTPKREILRSLCWYQYMIDNEGTEDLINLLAALKVSKGDWDAYYHEFKEYHKLP